MAGYTLYFHRADRSVPHFEFVSCASDYEALHVAKGQLLAHDSAEHVEVFNGEAVIGRVDRNSARIGRFLRAASNAASAEALGG